MAADLKSGGPREILTPSSQVVAKTSGVCGGVCDPHSYGHSAGDVTPAPHGVWVRGLAPAGAVKSGFFLETG